MERAKTAAKGRWACDVYPLKEAGDPRYVDLTSHVGLVRGGQNRLIADLDPRDRDRPSHHVALAGPGGSGKSTLLFQSLEELRTRGLYPVYVDVLDALDPGDIAYSDLLLTLVGTIDMVLAKDGIFVDAAASKDVRSWFAERALTTEHVKELNLSVEASAEAGVGVPLLGKLFSKVTAAFKGGSNYREQIRQRLDRSPNELVTKVNVYLDAALKAVQARKPEIREILFFYDNLEKVTEAARQIDEALIRRAALHRQIRCTTVHTVPFHLLLEPREGGLVKDAFEIFIVPMVALRSRDATRETLDRTAADALMDIIERRIDLGAVFESRSVVDDLIRASGGCTRDLLHLTQLACEYAGDGQITASVTRQAIRRSAAEHLRPARPSDFDTLARVHVEKEIGRSPDDFRLLYHRLAVHYDDVDWYDAHPLVWQDRRFDAALAKASALLKK